MLRCFAYRFHHDFTSHYRATINGKEGKHICAFLGALSDADNELKTKPGCEAKVAQYQQCAVDTFMVQHSEEHIV